MARTTTEQLLRDRHMRVTPQRMAVLDHIRSSTAHPTAEEIYNAVRRDFPSISLNTIYKSLDAFEKAGLVSKFVIGDRGNYRYDFTTESHVHHLCRDCGCVADIEPPAGDDLRALLRRIREDEDRIEVDRIEIHLLGRCADCARDDR